LHFGHHPLGFIDSIEAGLAEPFLLGNGANRGDLLADIRGDELAVSTHTALQINKVVGVANGPDALGDLLSLLEEALVLVASRCNSLRHLLQTFTSLWGAPGAALVWLVESVVEALLNSVEHLFRLCDGLVSRPLFGSHWRGNGLAQLLLHME
jgi:hypothetical protein